jgi:alkylated DNA repair dioxygenase AlkB
MDRQTALFDSNYRHSISLRDGGLIYFPQWLSRGLAQRYFNQLLKYSDWQQSTIRIAGKPVKIPRLNAWYGDLGASYQYSGKRFQPLIWTRPLDALRERLRRQLRLEGISEDLNSALLNYYRDGNDSVAWHADDEKELGPAPFIASISLGETRRFSLKRRDGAEKFQLHLAPGSLLLMLPPTQQHWLHSLPKTKSLVGARINVTYRAVIVQ